jgi:hypothetical protein
VRGGREGRRVVVVRKKRVGREESRRPPRPSTRAGPTRRACEGIGVPPSKRGSGRQEAHTPNPTIPKHSRSCCGSQFGGRGEGGRTGTGRAGRTLASPPAQPPSPAVARARLLPPRKKKKTTRRTPSPCPSRGRPP